MIHILTRICTIYSYPDSYMYDMIIVRVRKMGSQYGLFELNLTFSVWIRIGPVSHSLVIYTFKKFLKILKQSLFTVIYYLNVKWCCT